MPGTVASSSEMTSANARPIQSSLASELRFSKRRTAMRSIGARRDWPVQARQAAQKAARTTWLQDTRIRGQQLFELGKIFQSSEIRLFLQLVLLAEALFQGLSQILKGELVAAILGVQSGEVVVIFGAFLHAA